MKANTVFAVTMGKMSKIDANSAAIAANAEEIAEVREIAEGATAGAPIPKSLASEMVEGGVYLYTGSETGYTAGHVYYYVGGVLTDGGQYGGIAIDDTLTSPTMAAPASDVGQIKEDLSALEDAVEDIQINPDITGNISIIHNAIYNLLSKAVYVEDVSHELSGLYDLINNEGSTEGVYQVGDSLYITSGVSTSVSNGVLTIL